MTTGGMGTSRTWKFRPLWLTKIEIVNALDLAGCNVGAKLAARRDLAEASVRERPWPTTKEFEPRTGYDARNARRVHQTKERGI